MFIFIRIMEAIFLLAPIVSIVRRDFIITSFIIGGIGILVSEHLYKVIKKHHKR